MTLLSCIQDAMVRVNLAPPASAIGNVDSTVGQFVSFAQDVGDELAQRWPLSTDYQGNWVAHAGGSPGGRLTTDTDTCRIDEVTWTSGIVWRWLASKGLDYAEEFRRYEDRFALAVGRAGSAAATTGGSNLLTYIQDAMAQLKMPRPSSAFLNNDASVQQMVALAQDLGDELSERFFWRTLNNTATITGDGATTLWPIPSDFGQLSPGFEFVSASRPNFMLVGPVTNEQMNLLKALTFLNQPGGVPGKLLLANGVGNLTLAVGGSLSLTAVQQSNGAISLTVWRIVGSSFEFWPALGSGEVVTYSYYAQSWVQPAAVNYVLPARTTRFAADTDACLIDGRVIVSGLVARFLASKGQNNAEEMRRYEARLNRAAGREGTTRIVGMSNRRSTPDDWFPGTIFDLR